MDRQVATKTEKEKKRKCSVLTKHVKEYIKKEEEEDKKKNENKNKQKKNQRKTNYSFSNHCFFYLRWPDSRHFVHSIG